MNTSSENENFSLNFVNILVQHKFLLACVSKTFWNSLYECSAGLGDWCTHWAKPTDFWFLGHECYYQAQHLEVFQDGNNKAKGM